mmetsp:Transcript_24469/g.50376  ORF Transcript_24469/g.50376 Transcript_24469/m.50376 type:complete len:255 (+) Transcript_24469:389-1153(+)
MRLPNNLLRHLRIQPLLIEPKSIQGLIIRSLIPAEPLPNSVLHGRGNVVDIIVLLGQLVVGGNANDLPIQLSVVDHGQDSQRLHLRHGSHGQSLGTDLHHVNGIVVPEAFQFGMFLVGILPRLREASVVPKDWSVVVAKFSLFDILGDGVVFLLGGHLHFGFGHLGDFDDGVVGSLRGAVEGDVVPGGDGGVAGGEGEAEGLGGFFAGGGGDVGVEDGGGERAGGEGGGGAEGEGGGGGGAPCGGGGGGGGNGQ